MAIDNSFLDRLMLTSLCISELNIQNHFTNLYNITKIELLKEITPSKFFPHINSWVYLNVLDHKRYPFTAEMIFFYKFRQLCKQCFCSIFKCNLH